MTTPDMPPDLAARIQEIAERHAAEAPPLTEEQIARVRRIIAHGIADRDA